MAQAERIWVEPGILRRRQSALQGITGFARRKPLGFAGAVVIILVTLIAILAPWVAPYDPDSISLERLESPSLDHWLGTDNLGRDLFSRVVWGGRISLLVGVLSTIIGTGIGAVLALTSSFSGGRWDMIVQRFMDVLWAFPSLIIAMVLMFVLGTSTTNVIIAISIVLLPSVARVVRSQVLIVKEMDYVQAARAMGASDIRIMFRHVAINCAAPYIIIVTDALGKAIVIEASLSFLGMGIPPPTPSWGRDLFGAARNYAEVAPWMALAPGIALSLVVYGFNLFGDAVRDILDPRLRQ
jgi:peptide/nickel transport system permease protein